MCGGDGWEVEFYRAIERKARVTHRCDECGDLILPGQRYERCASKCDGSVSSWAHCLKCARIESAYFKAEQAVGHWGATYNRRELRDSIRECLSEEPHFVVAFRAAWKGLPVPKAPAARDTRHYSTVMS